MPPAVVMQPPQSANEAGWWLLRWRPEPGCYTKMALVLDHSIAHELAEAYSAHLSADD